MSSDAPLSSSLDGVDASMDAVVSGLASEARGCEAEEVVGKNAERVPAQKPGVFDTAGSPDARKAFDVREVFPTAVRRVYWMSTDVLLQTFRDYPHPGINFDALTDEAILRAVQELPTGASDHQVHERVLDIAAQMASDERKRLAGCSGYHLYCYRLVDLLGGVADPETLGWLNLVDGLRERNRIAYHLRDLYAMSNRKASELLGCRDSWTSKRYSRATNALVAAGVPVEELKSRFFDDEIFRRNCG